MIDRSPGHGSIERLVGVKPGRSMLLRFPNFEHLLAEGWP